MKKKKKSFTLASIFRTKKSSSNQNLPYIMLKTRSSFIYANTSLDTNCILKAFCRSVVLLLSKFSCFSILAFGNFFLSYVVLLNVPLSERVKRKKTVSAMGYFSHEILIQRHRRREVPLVVVTLALLPMGK